MIEEKVAPGVLVHSPLAAEVCRVLLRGRYHVHEFVTTPSSGRAEENVSFVTFALLKCNTVHDFGVSKRGEFDPFPKRRQFGWNEGLREQNVRVSETFRGVR